MAGITPAMIAFAGARAAESGSALFENCRACHSLDPAAAPMAGPNLAGLIGRRLGGDPKFDYSPLLRQANTTGQVWTRELLEEFLADPEEMFRGMWMSSRRIEDIVERKTLTDFITDPKSR